MSDKYSMTGGLRVDLFNVSWPFASLAASKDMIELSALSKEYLIEKDAITKLVKHKGLFSTGLKIEHKMQGVPAEPIFWTFSFTKLKKYLEQLGYEVDG